MSRIGWQLYDPVTTELYPWPVNPYQDNGSHSIIKESNYTAAAASYRDGLNIDRIGTVVHSRGVNMEPFSYTGRTYSDAELTALSGWFEKDYAVQLTDDLGRTYLILVENFSFERIRARHSPYKHSYNVSGIVLEEL